MPLINSNLISRDGAILVRMILSCRARGWVYPAREPLLAKYDTAENGRSMKKGRAFIAHLRSTWIDFTGENSVGMLQIAELSALRQAQAGTYLAQRETFGDALG